VNETMIPVAKLASSKQRKREAPRGRNVTPAALAEVEALVGKGPLRHDLLIEYLHLINDHYKQLGARTAALAGCWPCADRSIRSRDFLSPLRCGQGRSEWCNQSAGGAHRASLRRPELRDGGAKNLLERLPELLGAKCA